MLILIKIEKMQISLGIPVSLRNELKKMWERIFHDSEEYIDLFFENYISESYIGICKDDDRLIAGLFGVPYKIRCKELSSADKYYNGIYLCGLMTDEAYRGMGIMNYMLNSICKRTCNDGYVFTFLIPSNEKNRHYYNKRRFDNYFCYSEYRDVNLSNDESTDISNIRCYYSVDNLDSIDDICEYLVARELTISGMSICHTNKDYHVIIKEHFLSGGILSIVSDNDNIITGTAFILPDDNVITVKYLTADSKVQIRSLVKYIYGKFSGFKKIFRVFPGQQELIDSRIFLDPGIIKYGMLRNNCTDENIKIEDDRLSGLKFSIFAPEHNSGNFSESGCNYISYTGKGGCDIETARGSMFLMLD